jgi:hypothetical protein
MPVIPVTVKKCKVGGSISKLAWAKSKTVCPINITTANKAGGVIQAVDHLSCKCEALISNPSTVNK